MDLTFVPLAPAMATLIEDWFDDPETIRYLGGLDWLEATLTLDRRGAHPDVAPPQAVHSWLVLLGETPVAVVDVEIHGDGSAALQMAVAPARRRGGLARRILAALWDQPELAEVSEFVGYATADHRAARRLAAAAGFEADGPPDRDGKQRFRRRRPG